MTEWMTRGKCRGVDPNVFHPHGAEGIGYALQFCTGCPVRDECLEYALAEGIDQGIWGGESARGRRRMARTGRQRGPVRPIHQAGIWHAVVVEGVSVRAVAADYGVSVLDVIAIRRGDYTPPRPAEVAA